MKRGVLFFFIILLSYHADAAKPDTIKVYFDIGIPELSDASVRMLDSLIYKDIILPGKKYGIIGYADYLGDDESNVTLSEKRAQNVQAYLEQMGSKKKDIEIVIGKGEVKREIENGTAGYREDRRVDIIPGGFKVPVVRKPVPPPPPKPVAPTVDLTKIKKNETLRLDNMYFMPGSSIIRDDSKPELKKLYEIMKNNPSLRIRIEGHICCTLEGTTDGYDSAQQDFQLSTNRAKYIYDYLAEEGIDEDRMDYKGFGKTKPLVHPEKTLEDENRNRRVEIRILDK